MIRDGCPSGTFFYQNQCRRPVYVLDPVGIETWTTQGETIEWWTPDAFLSIVPWPEGRKGDAPLPHVAYKMLSGDPLHPVYIDIRKSHLEKLKDLNPMVPPRHEGLQRVWAAKQLGIEKIPVAVRRD